MQRTEILTGLTLAVLLATSFFAYSGWQKAQQAEKHTRKLEEKVSEEIFQNQFRKPVLPIDLKKLDGFQHYAQGGTSYNGNVYFTASWTTGLDHAKSETFPFVAKFDTSTGKLLKTYNFFDTYDSSPLVIPDKNGRLLVIAHEYKLMRTSAFDEKTGELVWYSKNNQRGFLFFGYSFVTLPDHSKLILAASRNGLHALSSEDGSEVWFLPADATGGVTPAVDPKKNWVFYQADNKLFKLDARTGKILEQAEVSAPARTISWNTMLVNDKNGYYVVTYWYGDKAWDSAIRVYDADLNLVWEKTGLPLSKKATLAYADGKIFSGGGDMWATYDPADKRWKKLKAYDVQTGKILWETDVSKYVFGSIDNVLYFGGYIFAETQDLKSVNTHLFKIDAKTGKIVEVLAYKAPTASCAQPIVVNGVFMTGDLNTDSVRAIRLTKGGKQDWEGAFGTHYNNLNAIPNGAKATEWLPMKVLTCDGHRCQ